jgi:hypothetical protein
VPVEQVLHSKGRTRCDRYHHCFRLVKDGFVVDLAANNSLATRWKQGCVWCFHLSVYEAVYHGTGHHWRKPPSYHCYSLGPPKLLRNSASTDNNNYVTTTKLIPRSVRWKSLPNSILLDVHDQSERADAWLTTGTAGNSTAILLSNNCMK